MNTSVHFHNTPGYEGAELQRRTVRAVRQSDKVLAIMEITGRPMSAEDIMQYYDDQHTPLTSIRRCLTNLTYEGKVEKATQVIGKYGVKIYQYKII